MPHLAPSYARTGTVQLASVRAVALLAFQAMSSAKTANAKELAGKDMS